jgi:hypothetical protein
MGSDVPHTTTALPTALAPLPAVTNVAGTTPADGPPQVGWVIGGGPWVSDPNANAGLTSAQSFSPSPSPAPSVAATVSSAADTVFPSHPYHPLHRNASCSSVEAAQAQDSATPWLLPLTEDSLSRSTSSLSLPFDMSQLGPQSHLAVGSTPMVYSSIPPHPGASISAPPLAKRRKTGNPIVLPLSAYYQLGAPRRKSSSSVGKVPSSRKKHVAAPLPPPLSPTSMKEMVDKLIRQVHAHDVLSGRGVQIAQHPGNERFRALVQTHTDAAYCDEYTTLEKRATAAAIIAHIQALDPPGRFLKRASAAVSAQAAAAEALLGRRNPAAVTASSSTTTSETAVFAGYLWEELTEEEIIKKTCQALRDCNRSDRAGYAAQVEPPPDVQVSRANRQGQTNRQYVSDLLKDKEPSDTTGPQNAQRQDEAEVNRLTTIELSDKSFQDVPPSEPKARETVNHQVDQETAPSMPRIGTLAERLMTAATPPANRALPHTQAHVDEWTAVVTPENTAKVSASSSMQEYPLSSPSIQPKVSQVGFAQEPCSVRDTLIRSCRSVADGKMTGRDLLANEGSSTSTSQALKIHGESRSTSPAMNLAVTESYRSFQVGRHFYSSGSGPLVSKTNYPTDSPTQSKAETTSPKTETPSFSNSPFFISENGEIDTLQYMAAHAAAVLPDDLGGHSVDDVLQAPPSPLRLFPSTAGGHWDTDRAPRASLFEDKDLHSGRAP